MKTSTAKRETEVEVTYQDPFRELLEKPLNMQRAITGVVRVIKKVQKALRPFKCLWDYKGKKASRLLAHRDNWVKGRVANRCIDVGQSTKPAPTASCACVGGALCVVLDIGWDKMEETPEAERLNAVVQKRGYPHFIYFNDAQETKHADVIAALKEAGL